MTKKVRVSVANLIRYIIVNETGEKNSIGILSVSQWRKKKIRFQALGGAAELSAFGRMYLKLFFRAKEFHETDARFQVPEKFLEKVINIFKKRNPRFSEISVSRELLEELTEEELEGMPAILIPQDVYEMEVVYKKTVRQKLSGTNTATEESTRTSVPTIRLFHIFDVKVSAETFKKIIAHQAIRIFSADEVATTGGGTRTGYTSDDVEIASNITEW